MKILLLIIILILLQNCSINKKTLHHGVKNLDYKQSKLIINETNKNDIIKLIGPPSTKSAFDNDVYIYIEKKTSNSKLTKLGKTELLINNVLILEVNDKGVLVSKKLYNKEDMMKIKFSEDKSILNYEKNSFISQFLLSLRDKIDDPLGKKRSKSN